MNININRVKVIVTVPEDYLDEVRDAICDAGAGIIGEYTYCSMSSKCVGTFIPSDVANPFIGSKGKMEFVKEEKLEVVCDINKVKDVLISLRKAHPYEEPAIDIIPLIDEGYFN